MAGKKQKTFKIKVNQSNWGWITINNGEIVSCSEKHKWSLHLPFSKIDNWLLTKGSVEYVRIG